MPDPCTEPLINAFFSIIGRLGIFSLCMDATSDLTLNQLRILFHLFYHDGKTMSEIADKLQVSHPTATGVIDRLEDRALVQRLPDPDDRRKVRLALTESGKSQIAEIRRTGAQAAQAAFAQLTAAQRDALLAALAPVYTLLMSEFKEKRP